MNQPTVDSYQFGDFQLFPQEKILLHFSKPVPMPGKDFEILSYLVEHADSIVSQKEITEFVWGSGIEVTDGNMSHLMAKIRKAIGCDARKPKFIRTIYNKKTYRFIAPVRRIIGSGEHLPPVTDVPRSNTTYKVTTHLFAPLFLGEDTYGKLILPEIENDWSTFKIRETTAGTLYIGSNGFGVWHVTHKHEVREVSQIAIWRKQIYREILAGKHSIKTRTNEILKSVGLTGNSSSGVGTIGYIFSVAQLEGTSLRRKETVRNLLKSLASLSLLEDIKSEAARSQRMETELLSGEIEFRGVEEFGQPGIDIGFACWDGASYFHSAKERPTIEDKIVECEIKVQSLWWACRLVTDLRAGDPPSVRRARNLIPGIKRSYGEIRTILARESPSQRSMVEAIVRTSRIRQMVEAATDD